MKTFTVRFTGDENAALRREAKKNELSVSEQVRVLLNPWFQKQKREKNSEKEKPASEA